MWADIETTERARTNGALERAQCCSGPPSCSRTRSRSFDRHFANSSMVFSAITIWPGFHIRTGNSPMRLLLLTVLACFSLVQPSHAIAWSAELLDRVRRLIAPFLRYRSVIAVKGD